MASKISGVGVHTIRAWEKRYKALEPVRDASGHRTYSKSDVEKLILLSELCLLGYTISKVATMSIAELKMLLIDLGKTQESLEAQDFSLVNESKFTVDAFQSLPILSFALKSYKLDIISLELGKLKLQLSARDLALQALLPLFDLLNELVDNSEYTSAQEEAMRAILKFHMGHYLYHPTEKLEKKSISIVLGGMKGDASNLASDLVGLLCGHHGFQYTYLGSDIAHENFSDIAQALNTNLVIIATSKSHEKMDKSYIQNYVERLLNKLDSNVDLVLVTRMNIVVDKNLSKRLVLLKTISAVDEYLLKKNN